MIDILQVQYPTYKSRKEIWISAVVVAALVYLFLIIFQPFGTYNYIHDNKYLLLFPYALIAFLTFLSADSIVSKNYHQWRWKNEIYKTLIALFFCALLNYWYSIYFINYTFFSLYDLMYMVVFTYALGIPVCTITILARYGFLKGSSTEVDIQPLELNTYSQENDNLMVLTDVEDKIEFSRNDFLYARSEGNYTSIYYLKERSIKNALHRISLKNLEEQICDSNIVRCHRSFIFNSKFAVKKQGNAQGYKISLMHSQEMIPVSRKYVDIVQKLVKKYRP